jgi:hypothetical protein
VKFVANVLATKSLLFFCFENFATNQTFIRSNGIRKMKTLENAILIGKRKK